MIKYIVFLNLFLINNCFAENNQRIIERYRQHNQSFQLHCSIYDKTNTLENIAKVGDIRFVKGKKIEQQFKLITTNKTLFFNLLIKPDLRNKAANFVMSFDDGPKFSGKVLESFGRQYKKLIRLKSGNKFYERYKLSQLKCYIEFSISKSVQLNGNVHISVHPHARYDYKNLLTHRIENLIANHDFNVVLLEDGNFKENLVDLYSFMISGKTKLPINDYGVIRPYLPDDVEMFISPAGHNRYTINSNEPISIDYSGGNHNYCIWNNSRNIIESLLVSEFNPELTINYLTDSIVLQCGRGIIRGLGISCRSLRPDNLLSRFLKTSQRTKYHQSYFQYFVNVSIPFYKHRYRKVHFSYEASSFNKHVQLEGNGTRILRIKIVYK